MSAELALVQAGTSVPQGQAGALPAVLSHSSLPPRRGEGLSLALAASEAEDRAASAVAEGPALDAERLTVYRVAL